MGFLAGKSGIITIGAATWKLSDWTIDMQTDALDVTNFSSGGAKENIAGLLSGKISASGAYDSASMALTSGTSYAFVLSMVSGTAITVTARVTNIQIKTDVKDAVRVSITAESTATFTAAIT